VEKDGGAAPFGVVDTEEHAVSDNADVADAVTAYLALDHGTLVNENNRV
jgi:hypothetical protein